MCEFERVECILPIVRVKIEIPKGHEMYKIEFVRSDSNVYECFYCQRAIAQDRENGYLVTVLN